LTPQKITFAEMRDMGVRGLLIYCSDYKCSHLITMGGDRWPMTCACPTLRRGLSAQRAASVAQTCGRTSAAMDSPLR
jgi:hypothetical protein